jgi:hypothetical protein
MKKMIKDQEIEWAIFVISGNLLGSKFPPEIMQTTTLFFI